jgi:hypothetical protein
VRSASSSQAAMRSPMHENGRKRASKRGWWVNLRCSRCNTHVYADNGQFSRVYEGSVARDTARHWPGDCGPS